MNTKQKQFITLRAEGMTFDNIVKKIGTSKATLIKWNRMFQDEIKDMEFQAMLDLKESFSYNNKKKYEQLLKHLDKVDKGIETADISTTSIKDLLLIRNDINHRLEQLEKSTVYSETNLVTKCEYTGKQEVVKVHLNEL